MSLGDKYFNGDERLKSNSLINQHKYLSKKYPNFPIVIGNIDGKGRVFLGGDQDWFKLNGHYTKFTGGCGSVGAANTLAQFAYQDPATAKKLGLSTWNQSRVATMGEYLYYMEDVYDTVKTSEIPFVQESKDRQFQNGNSDLKKGLPPSLGIWNEGDFYNGIMKYANEHEVWIKGTKVESDGTSPYNASTIEKAVSENKPIVYLVGLNEVPYYNPDGTEKSKYKAHWVNITGKEGEKMNISTWGQDVYIKYSEQEIGPMNTIEIFELTTQEESAQSLIGRLN